MKKVMAIMAVAALLSLGVASFADTDTGKETMSMMKKTHGMMAKMMSMMKKMHSDDMDASMMHEMDDMMAECKAMMGKADRMMGGTMKGGTTEGHEAHH